jgi:hypothetical protein
MNKVNLIKLQDALRVHIDLELTIAEFYKTCAENWPEDGAFWTDVSKQELQHAEYIEKMSNMISNRPDNFILGRSFNPVAINTIISGIKKNIDLVKADVLTQIKVLYIASDIEKSALESKIDEIVKTDDLGFLELVREIVLQTEKHREQFNNKIAMMEAN